MNTQGPDDASMLTLLDHGHGVSEGKVPQTVAQRRQAHLLFDDGKGLRRRRHRHADRGGEGRQRGLSDQRREVVFVLGQRRRRRAGDGEDRSERAAASSSFPLSWSSCRTPDTRSSAMSRRWRSRGRLPTCCTADTPRIEIRDLEGAGRQSGRRRRQRFYHGPASPRLWPPAPRHAQRRHGAARARYGSSAVTERSTFGKLLAERQAVQFMLADCASELYIGRLMLLHIAYKAEKKIDMRQENGIAKVFVRTWCTRWSTPRSSCTARSASPRYAARPMVHQRPLAAAGRRSGRSAQMADRQERHQGVPRTRHHGKRRGRGFAVDNSKACVISPVRNCASENLEMRSA